jgi:hypothetical protein
MVQKESPRIRDGSSCFDNLNQFAFATPRVLPTTMGTGQSKFDQDKLKGFEYRDLIFDDVVRVPICNAPSEQSRRDCA